MKLNTVLAPLTLATFVFAIVTILNHLRVNGSNSAGENELSPSSDPSNSAARSVLAESKSLLVTGISSKIPISEDYKLLTKIPWESQEIARLFRDAGVESSCELLDVGADVVQPLLPAVPKTAGPLGRRCAFSIRLQIGKELGEGLPTVTRGIIEDYLKSHQLTIQPAFYFNEKGRLVLGPTIRAAFVRLDAPEQATVAESMIARSIGELRTLGVYWGEAKPFAPSEVRTLVLGFRYTLDIEGAVSKASPKREYELLFLHLLPDATLENPRLAVFATSNARAQFHLLEESDPNSVEQMAAITADVRFADAKLMGMYPENPVVTRVSHRALLSIPVDLVLSQMEGLAGVPPEGGFAGILDKLYVTAMGETFTPTSETPVEVEPRTPAPEATSPDFEADPKAAFETLPE
jgi:hypothetical protein